MTSYAIELHGISKRWGENHVLKQLSLKVETGSFTALLGPSGCGKSTLLRIIAGLEQASAGQVLINGKDVTHTGPAARELSMVFQSYALFPHLSVQENILFGLQVRGVSRSEQAQRLKRAIELTNLDGLGGRKPGQLSGGQRQRVALARCIVSGHRLCLMDEPLSNLDAKLRHTVRHEIRALQRSLGLTVVYVTHDQTEALGMADQVVLLNAGQVAQQGTAQDLYQQPNCVFSAGFIGSPPMMLIHSDCVPLALWPTRQLCYQPHRVCIGVRPENLLLGPLADDVVQVTIVHHEFQGADAYVYVQLLDGRQLIVRAPHQTDLLVGARCGLSWLPEHAFYFDEDTGQRLTLDSPSSGLL